MESYYDYKKKELKELLKLLENEKKFLSVASKQSLRDIENKKNELDKEILLKDKELEKKINENKKIENGIIQMAKERQIGFPWLAQAYEELLCNKDEEIVRYLKDKSYSAKKTAELIRDQNKIKRKAIKDKKIAEYLVKYYESIAPFLVDLKEEVDFGSKEEIELMKEYSEKELADETINYLTKEEYRKLPSIEKNQTALDRFWKRKKSKWLIGRLYERYVGYLYEQKGYDVEYVGIFKGFEDLGRDLICKKENNFIIIQCKYWAQFRTIYEKHIFQFFGTVFQYKDESPEKNVKGIFYTSTELSGLARRFSKELNIGLEENFKFDKEYPCIKCNISRKNNEKIYHLPFDQQYDKVKIEKDRGEFYCKTVEEAEKAGFRRAFKYHQKNK